MKTIASQIASLLDAYVRCKASGNADWEYTHYQSIQNLLERLPSGSGIDAGTGIAGEMWDAPDHQKLVFVVGFHHMDENGTYDGWTHHRVVVTPTFGGISVKVVGGHDRNGIKEYLGELYHTALSEVCK
jgi:hypothetical protein